MWYVQGTPKKSRNIPQTNELFPITISRQNRWWRENKIRLHTHVIVCICIIQGGPTHPCCSILNKLIMQNTVCYMKTTDCANHVQELHENVSKNAYPQLGLRIEFFVEVILHYGCRISFYRKYNENCLEIFSFRRTL